MKVLNMIPTFLLAMLILFDICSLKFRFLLMVTPRSFSLSTFVIIQSVP